MQRAAVLIVPSSFVLDELKSKIKNISRVSVSKGDTETEFEVRYNEQQFSYVIIDYAPERDLAIEDYSDSDDLDAALRSSLADCEFIVLLSNSLDLLKLVVDMALRYAIGLGGSWLDDNHGHVLEARVVLGRLEAEPEWDLVDRGSSSGS